MGKIPGMSPQEFGDMDRRTGWYGEDLLAERLAVYDEGGFWRKGIVHFANVVASAEFEEVDTTNTQAAGGVKHEIEGEQ